MRGKKCCTQRIKKKKFCFFSRKQFWAAAERAQKAERDRPKRFFQSLSRFLRIVPFIPWRKLGHHTLVVYTHNNHTHTTRIINESVLSNERARARHGEWKTREPSIGVANYSSSGHRGAIIIILFFFERDRYGKE
jgi:hypothetical protein